MSSSRTTSWMPIAGVVLVVGASLWWLLVEFASPAGDFRPLRELPDGRINFFVETEPLSVEAIERLPASAWQSMPVGRDRVNLPKRRGVWIRVVLVNQTEARLDGVLDAADFFVDRVEAWSRSSQSPELIYAVTGEAIPLAQRAWWGRELALPIAVPAQSETTVFVRGEDFSGSGLQLVWWTHASQFKASQMRGLLAEGIYFGVLIALLGYNALLWLRLRLRDIGYYVLYLGSVAVFMALARSVPALGGWTLASPRLESLISSSIAASGVCLLLFARVFVELKEVLPKVDVAARVVIGIVALGGIGSLMGNLFPEFYWLRTVMLLVAGTHLGVVVIVAWLWRIGSRPARFFTAAFGCFFSATLPVIAMWFGRYTSEHPPMMFLMVGSALEMLLLSFATAERFAQAQREKEIAQQNLLEETEQRRAMQEAYADELTVEVRERTRELESANTDKDRMITILGHDLRGPLTSLTQTAGQLTAEPGNVARLQKFVADSAQTGREALLLIEDLLVWAQLRNGSPHPAGKHLVRALVAPVVTLHQALAGQRGVQLIVDVPEGLRISTDLVLAQTLLRNLVANALKFADARVELSAQATAEGVELCVRDDGPGLPAPVLAAVSGGEEMPVTAASGLGLRLCVDISRSLGTRLHVEVRDPQGTEFKFILSAVPGDRPLPLSSV